MAAIIYNKEELPCPPKTNHTVILTGDEAERLKTLTHKDSGGNAGTVMHAYILLLTNGGLGPKKKTNKYSARSLSVHPALPSGAGPSAVSITTASKPPVIFEICGGVKQVFLFNADSTS